MTIVVAVFLISKDVPVEIIYYNSFFRYAYRLNSYIICVKFLKSLVKT